MKTFHKKFGRKIRMKNGRILIENEEISKILLKI